jgi:2-methylcitrate dehydratase PrpD
MFAAVPVSGEKRGTFVLQDEKGGYFMPQAAEQKTAVQLAHYAVHLNFEDIPLSVVENMKTLVLDYLGVALRGSAAQSAKIAKDFQREYGACKPESTVIGGGLKLTSQAAAFANAVSAHSIELDDVDEMALFHYGPPVISAALAAAESVYASGKEFLLAAVIGCDLMKRLSDAMNPMLRDRGFHTTPCAACSERPLPRGGLKDCPRRK